MSILVLEGPDGAGKTTLARKLLKKVGLPTILISRSGSPDLRETIHDQINWINTTIYNYPVNVILDRHPLISEKIYAPILRGEDRLGLDLDDIASAFPCPRVLVLYCRPPMASIIEGVQTEEQLDGVVKRLMVLTREYDKMMYALADRGVRVRRYDYTETHDDGIARWVRSFFKTGDFDGPLCPTVREAEVADGEVLRDPAEERTLGISGSSGLDGDARGDSPTSYESPLDRS